MITTYTELQAAILDWLNRNDAETTAQVPTFIQLTEGRLKRVIKTKHQSRQTLNLVAGTGSVNLTPFVTRVTSLYVTVPDNLGGIIHPTSPEQLFTARTVAVRASASGASGRPVQFTVIDTEILVSPLADQDYTLEAVVEGPFLALSGTQPSNYILDDYPDVYLYGALVESAPYLKEDERLATWQQRYDRALAELELAQLQNDWPNTPIATQPAAYGQRVRNFDYI